MITVEVDEDETSTPTLLPTLLRAAVMWGRPVRWALSSIEAVGQIEAVWPQGVVHLEEAARRRTISFATADIIAIGDALDDVIGIELTAETAGSIDASFRITRFDSGSWRIDASDATFVDALRALGLVPTVVSEDEGS